MTLHVPTLLALLGAALMTVAIFAPKKRVAPPPVAVAAPRQPADAAPREAAGPPWPALVDPRAVAVDAETRIRIVAALVALDETWCEEILRHADAGETDPAVRRAIDLWREDGVTESSHGSRSTKTPSRQSVRTA